MNVACGLCVCVGRLCVSVCVNVGVCGGMYQVGGVTSLVAVAVSFVDSAFVKHASHAFRLPLYTLIYYTHSIRREREGSDALRACT
jgi:hypothetical protein